MSMLSPYNVSPSIASNLTPIKQSLSELEDLRKVMLNVTSSQKFELMDSIIATLTTSLRLVIESEVQKRVETFSTKLSAIEKRISVLEKRDAETWQATERDLNHFNQRISYLEDQLDGAQQYAMRNQLIFDAIPESADEGTDNLVIAASKKLNIAITGKDIEKSHRLGPKDKNRIRPIIVHFQNNKTKKQIITAVKDDLFSAISARRNQRQNTNGIKPKLLVREHLTRKRAGMLRDLIAMKKDKLLHSVWTEDGAIIVRMRQGERVLKINS